MSKLNDLIQKATKTTIVREWDEDCGCFGASTERHDLDSKLLAKLIVNECCREIRLVGAEQFDIENTRRYTKAVRARFGLPDEWPFG